MSDIDRRNLEIQELIKDFSKLISEEEMKSKLVSLNDIYDNEFRHKYSQMLIAIQNIEPSGREILIMNFEKAFDLLRNDKSISVSEKALKGFEKLYDHVMLDISRLNYLSKNYGKQDSELKEKFEKAQAEMETAILRYSELDGKIQKFSNDVTNAKSEYITILSILAAIMLAGIGGFSVLSNFASMMEKFHYIDFLLEQLFWE